jgi:hypothetical protein
MTEKRKPPNAGKGRVKGVPNKVTATARKVMQMVADGRGEDFIRWMDETASGQRGKKGWSRAPNPEGAARLYLQALEFTVPKLARTELTGRDGEAIPITFVPADKGL